MMETNFNVDTFFAPAGRVAKDEFVRQKTEAKQDPIVDSILKAVGGLVLILNNKRQILLASAELEEYLANHERPDFEAQRPGEAFGCVRVKEGPDGCGTSPYCYKCGAALAILAAQEKDEIADRECLMLVRDENGIEAREFKVHTMPIWLKSDKYIVFVLQDISSDKRIEAMENVFFHDLGNILSALLLWSETYERISTPKEAISRIAVIAKQLETEIAAQRVLRLAESKNLRVNITKESVREIFNKLKWFFEPQMSGSKQLRFEISDPDDAIDTDFALLNRILSNMIKNAVEASDAGQTVSARFFREGGGPVFEVHNDTFIPKDIAVQIFNRSFSTKSGTGRGIGTYSMKLFGENYLCGKVSFETSEEAGTTFRICLPKDYDL